MSSKPHQKTAVKGKAVGWEFLPVPSRGHHTSTRDEHHFQGDAIAVPLVRETGQNTKDAQANGSPAVLSFRIEQLSVAGGACLKGMFSPVLDHWDELGEQEAEKGGMSLRSLVEAHEHSVLLIEDYGTTGLLGPVDNHELDGGFASMLRWSGASEKSRRGGAQGGQYGLGKATIPAASHARCYFALTVREGELDNPVFMGKAMLPTHLVDGRAYEGAAFYYDSLLNDVGPELPFRGRDARELGQLLGANRGREPGTSLIVPWPVDGIDEDSLRLAAARSFFHQITRGDLVVEVGGSRLDAESIRVLLADEPDLLIRQRLGEAFSDEAVSCFQVIVPAGAFTLDDILNTADIARLREDWRRGRTVVLHAHFFGPAAGAQADIAYAISPRIKDEAVGSDVGRPFFVRRGVTLRTTQGRMRSGAFLAEVRSDKASAFLASCETPAHTAWKRPKQKALADLLSAIIELPMIIERTCLPEDRSMDVKSALTDFFKVSLPGREREDSKPKPVRRTAKDLPEPPVTQDEPLPEENSQDFNPEFNFDFREDAVSLTKSLQDIYEEGVFHVDGLVPSQHAGKRLRFLFAYKVNKTESNFRNHDSRDFDITNANVSISGGEIIGFTPNSIKVRVAEGPFVMSIEGFHEHRALDRKVVVEEQEKSMHETSMHGTGVQEDSVQENAL